MTMISRRQMLAIAAGAAATSAWAAETWTEGKHYFRIPQTVPPRPGAVTVTEVFSYGCPACNAFLPYMDSLEKKLPAGVTTEYVPASWVAAENWPVFQRAYITAKALGVAKQAHAAMFQAIWGQNGELAIADPRTGRLRSPLPNIEAVARFYEPVSYTHLDVYKRQSSSLSRAPPAGSLPSRAAEPGECARHWRRRACRHRGTWKPRPRPSTPVRRPTAPRPGSRA